MKTNKQRNKQKPAAQQQLGERETPPQTPKSVQKEGEEALQALEPKPPCGRWRGPWWSRLFPPPRSLGS